jgi:hypothetical protein
VSLRGSVVASRAGVVVPGIEASHVVFVRMPAWLVPLTTGRVAAMTLGRVVLVDPAILADVADGSRPELVAHELIHVRQWSEDGAIRFLRRYLGDYLRLRLLGCDHEAAYRGIGYEWSAYAEAHHMVHRP